MKVTPKLQLGGGFERFFTTYLPVQAHPAGIPPQSRGSGRGSGGSSRSSDDNEKGKLTEKDFFGMLKEIDGLPNEMMALVSNLTDTFRLNNLTGIDTGDLATTYLLNLYQVKIASQNKAKYDKAMENAGANGSLAEPAISMDGKLVVQNKDGELTTVGLDTYFKNKDDYTVLTVSNIAHYRAYDPDFNNNQTAFDIINNSMGFEAFLKLLTQAKQSLGSTEVTRNGYFTNEGEASKGLALLQTLSKDDQVQALGSVTAEGLYKYKIIDKNQLNQINALTSYMAAVFPDRAKTWAAIKMGTPNKDAATKNLVLQYLLSGENKTHQFDINYQGTMDHVMGKTKEKTPSEEDPKEGFWRQVQTGQGGDNATLNFLVNTGTMSTEGKFYGTTPGLDNDCSLNDYLSASGVKYMIKDPKDITFGDVRISPDSFNDVMVNAGSGAYVVTLPVKDGKVWVEAVEVYSEFEDKLKESGLQKGTPEYQKEAQTLLSQPEYMALAPIMQANGELKPSNSGQFLVLQGLTSSKASGIYNGEKESFGNIDSNFIISAGDDKELYRTLSTGLTSKERGEYKLDYNEWYDVPSWFNSYDKIYKGNIYIPLTTNPINAMNADKNDIKTSTAYKYESAQLTWEKENNKGAVDSKMLLE